MTINHRIAALDGHFTRVYFRSGTNLCRLAMYDDYELFVAIVDGGSLTAAAKRLGLARPVVTKRLARLEDRLGTVLLKRSTRSLTLTEDGQLFHDDISPIVAAARDAETRLKSRTRKLSGELRIRTVNSLGRRFLAPMLASFVKEHPDIRIAVQVEDRPIDLLTSRIDAEVTFTPPSWNGAIIEQLAPDRRILVASPDYIARKGNPAHPGELDKHDILAAPASLPWRLKGPDRIFTHHGRIAVITNSSELPGALALHGLGIALRPVWAMMDELRDGSLVRILPQYESDAFWSIGVATHANRRPSVALNSFIAHLKNSFSGLAAEVDAQLASLTPANP